MSYISQARISELKDVGKQLLLDDIRLIIKDEFIDNKILLKLSPSDISWLAQTLKNVENRIKNEEKEILEEVNARKEKSD